MVKTLTHGDLRMRLGGQMVRPFRGPTRAEELLLYSSDVNNNNDNNVVEFVNCLLELFNLS